MIKYYNRKEKTYEIEQVAAGKFIDYIYTTKSGKTLLEAFLKKKIFTSLYGKYCDTSLSKKGISKFVNNFNIDMSTYEKSIDDYTSFNDFFYRKLKLNTVTISNDPSVLISPCDSKLLAITDIGEDTSFSIKGFNYTVKEILKDDKLAQNYKNGTCLIFRLCPTDYHRFHFIDNGTCSVSKKISGRYYSVNPVALENVSKVFTENKREISILHSENFDDVLYVEVGATFVGSIIQCYEENKPIIKGDEKGYFKFGGSTVMLFFKENTINLDDDILINSKDGIESYVKFGEKIGSKY